jgi:hypothetical protein
MFGLFLFKIKAQIDINSTSVKLNMIYKALVPGFILYLAYITAFAQEAGIKSHFGVSVVAEMGRPIFPSSSFSGGKSKLGYGIGGDFYLDLNSKFQLRIGLMVQDVKINYRDYSPLFPGDAVNGEGNPYLSYWDFDYANQFVSIFPEGKLKLGDAAKANHFFVTGGIRIQHRFQTSGEVHLIETGTLTLSRDIDSFGFDVQKTWVMAAVGIGYEGQFGKGKFFVQPTFVNALTKFFDEESPVAENGFVQSLGIRTGYYW